jgi:hypothetical protein
MEESRDDTGINTDQYSIDRRSFVQWTAAMGGALMVAPAFEAIAGTAKGKRKKPGCRNRGRISSRMR